MVIQTAVDGFRLKLEKGFLSTGESKHEQFPHLRWSLLEKLISMVGENGPELTDTAVSCTKAGDACQAAAGLCWDHTLQGNVPNSHCLSHLKPLVGSSQSSISISKPGRLAGVWRSALKQN